MRSVVWQNCCSMLATAITHSLCALHLSSTVSPPETRLALSPLRATPSPTHCAPRPPRTKTHIRGTRMTKSGPRFRYHFSDVGVTPCLHIGLPPKNSGVAAAHGPAADGPGACGRFLRIVPVPCSTFRVSCFVFPQHTHTHTHTCVGVGACHWRSNSMVRGV